MKNDRDKQRDFDQARRKRSPWRKWYFTKTWKRRRQEQLALVPWCEPCKRMGKSRPATIANHKTPHRGNRELFFKGELESACKNCHDQAIQRAEVEGFSREIDAEGWPVDPGHPFNSDVSEKPRIRFRKAARRAEGFARPGVR